jgi:hypothetical protein
MASKIVGIVEVEEERFVVDTFMGLTVAQLRDFLRTNGLPVSGTKTEIRTRVDDALKAKVLKVADLLEALDEVTPWWKHHAFFLDAPDVVPACFTSAVVASGSIRPFLHPRKREERRQS